MKFIFKNFLLNIFNGSFCKLSEKGIIIKKKSRRWLLFWFNNKDWLSLVKDKSLFVLNIVNCVVLGFRLCRVLDIVMIVNVWVLVVLVFNEVIF